MAHPLRSARIKKFRTVIQEVEVLFSEVIYRGLFVACAVTFDSRYRYLRSLRIDIFVLIVPVISSVVALPTNVIVIHDVESYVITRYRSGSSYLDGQYTSLFVKRRRHISRIVERIRHPTVIPYVLVLEYVFVSGVLLGIDAYDGGHENIRRLYRYVIILSVSCVIRPTGIEIVLKSQVYSVIALLLTESRSSEFIALEFRYFEFSNIPRRIVDPRGVDILQSHLVRIVVVREVLIVHIRRTVVIRYSRQRKFFLIDPYVIYLVGYLTVTVVPTVVALIP